MQKVNKFLSILLTIAMVSACLMPIVNAAGSEETPPVYTLAKDEVVAYMTAAKEAYVTEEYADYKTSIVQNYAKTGSANSDIPNPVTLTWDSISGASNYTLLVSTSADFAENNTIQIKNIEATSQEVYNLYTNTEYWWKVQAEGVESAVQTFKTDDTVRFIYADGARNVRDLGGWNGLNQGLAYRGSELDWVEGHELQLTEKGRIVLHDDLGIKTDLDFRSTSLQASPIGNDVQFVNVPIKNFLAAYEDTANFKTILETFADIDNYPIYFHCWGGADRTGTVAFLLECLCGVAEEDMAIDLEVTSFSIFGNRYRYDNGNYYYASMLNKMKEYQGTTLKEKAENYALTTLGLTRAQISNIQSILSGNGVVFAKTSDLTMGSEIAIPLRNLSNQTVTAVTHNGDPVDFGVSDGVLTISSLDTLGSGVITFDDGNTLTFAVAEGDVISACTTQQLGDGFTRLTMKNTEFTAGETYRFPVTIEKDGDYAVFINKGDTTANHFYVTFKNDKKEITAASGSEANDGYKYNYVRAGAGKSEAVAPVTLTKGDWIVSVKPAVSTTVTYMDIRSTIIPVNDTPRAIYPSDFNTYNMISNNNVNGEISKAKTENTKVTGYSYYGDYANENLESKFNHDRQIHVAYDAKNPRTVGYKLNVETEGTYEICLTYNFYIGSTALTEDTTVTLSVNAGDAHKEISEVVKSGSTGKTEIREAKFEVPFKAGEQALTITPGGKGAYLYHLTIKKADLEASVSIEGSKASVSATLSESCTGTAIVALYGAKEELIDIKTVPLNQSKQFTADFSEVPASVKVFVWDDLDMMSPLMKSVTITNGDANWSAVQ